MLPNQNNKLSSDSIVRATPKIEIEIESEDELPEGTHVMPDGTVMPDSEHDMEKHLEGKHDQSSHSKGGGGAKPASAPKLRNGSMSEQRYAIENEMKGLEDDWDEARSEQKQLDTEIERLKGQAKMATRPAVRREAQAKIPKLESRRSQVTENMADIEVELGDLQLELDEMRFR